MGLFKPEMQNQSLPVPAIDTSKIKITLADALKEHGIQKLHNFRIVKLYHGYYYQIQQLNYDTLTYINCFSGKLLLNADKHYAAFLAQRFLSEPNNIKTKGHSHHTEERTLALAGTIEPKETKHPTWKIISTQLIQKFDSEYKGSNKLLPVYKVSFQREDGIRLYVETVADRLVLAVDDKKTLFTKFFSIAHSWSFLNNWGKLKSVVLGSFSALCFITSLFGFYIYNISNKKRVKRTSTGRANRHWHRVLGNVFLITTLLYAFSGAWHAFAKIPVQSKASIAKLSTEFRAEELSLDLSAILTLLKKEEKLVSVSAVMMDNKAYWRLTVSNGKTVAKKYLDQTSLTELKDGDIMYGRYLACTYSKHRAISIICSNPISSFNSKYSMMNKRLPVVEVNFAQGPDYFVETSTGSLAAVVSSSGQAERFSFSNLHMHHYWEAWFGCKAGKSLKNVVLIGSTLGMLLVAATGMMIYARKRFGR
jgi:hypothetical protein